MRLAQLPVKCYHRSSPITLDGLLSLLASSVTDSVVWVGENHDDRVAQQLERHVLEALYLQSVKDGRPLVLSLEFVDRAQQVALEAAYRSGDLEQVVPEAWLPLAQFAREHALRIVAANAPRQLSGRVARIGRDAFVQEMQAAATSVAAEREWCAPLPWPAPSAAYAEAFQQMMGVVMRPPVGDTAADERRQKLQRMLDAQTLWDATMAHSIASVLDADPQCRIMHVSGVFHVARRLGSVEMLEAYRPGTSSHVLCLYPGDVDEARLHDGDSVLFTGQGAVDDVEEVGARPQHA
ncbi:hypothetical protein CDCA_CDCA15G4026 [Cyanidium caldarium]|uniref:Haem-binding uptake Tiki superfamily ChaN domain-containing protein n=1 Tax=Cyanidium caldarium TaxID=2771 RepID=A0AAV9J132_CYACA|nr:hypothetical protein CDCA_CDCA15G4026 [Cyanidium caldarium]